MLEATIRTMPPGARGLDSDRDAAARALAADADLPPDVSARVLQTYGVFASRVAGCAAADRAHAERISPDRPAIRSAADRARHLDELQHTLFLSRAFRM